MPTISSPTTSSAWVPNPNYPADPRPFRSPPRPSGLTILYGLTSAPTLFHAKIPDRTAFPVATANSRA
jgi:hypothetical protein